MVNKENTQIVLASQSPRRKELLKNLIVSFKCMPAKINEVIEEGKSPQLIVESLANQKALHIVEKINANNLIVIGADTIVVIDDCILGKPTTKSHAMEMMQRLQGRTHDVFTGVVMVNTATNQKLQRHAKTAVTFDKMTTKEIATYVASGEPFDKAGGYGIQGLAGKYITGISGCYYNVVGFPLNLCKNMLDELMR